MGSISLSDRSYWSLRHDRGTISRGHELFKVTRVRLQAMQASRSDLIRSREPELALLIRLSDPRCAAVVADLMTIAEGITDEPDDVAKLVMLRVSSDPPLLVLLYDVPLDRAERIVAEEWALDRPAWPPGHLDAPMEEPPALAGGP
jgi:hypothetical protein